MANMNFGGSRNYNGANAGGNSFGSGGFGNEMGNGFAQFFGGLTGDSGAPYEAGREAYQPYLDKAAGAQQPYMQAGQGALGNYQGWLQGQHDPSGFINHLMSQYQESPWAKYQQQQGIRAVQNAGSNDGTQGSTAQQLQLQQNAQGISSQDMQNWLGNVLGINSNYGAGQQSLIQGGQNAANSLSNIYNTGGENLAGLGIRQRAGEQQDTSNVFGGLGYMLPGLASMFFGG